MNELNDKIVELVGEGADQEAVQAAVDELNADDVEFNPTGRDVPAGNSVYLGFDYMRFEQRSSRDAQIMQAKGHGIIVGTTDELMARLYGRRPAVAPVAPELESESDPEPEQSMEDEGVIDPDGFRVLDLIEEVQKISDPDVIQEMINMELDGKNRDTAVNGMKQVRDQLLRA